MQNAVQNGTMIWVDSYIRDDGKKLTDITEEDNYPIKHFNSSINIILLDK